MRILVISVLLVGLVSTASLGLADGSFVQLCGNRATATDTTITCTFGSNVTSANAVAVQASWDLIGGANVTATASGVGCTFSAAQDAVDQTGQDPNRRAATFYGENCTGGSTVVTITFSQTTTTREVIAHEIAGVATSGSQGGHTGQFQATPGTGTDAVTSGSITTSVNGCYIFGTTTGGLGGSIITAGTGYTARFNAGGNNHASEDRVQASAGSIAATFTLDAGLLTLTHVIAACPGGGAETFGFYRRRQQ